MSAGRRLASARGRAYRSFSSTSAQPRLSLAISAGFCSGPSTWFSSAPWALITTLPVSGSVTVGPARPSQKRVSDQTLPKFDGAVRSPTWGFMPKILCSRAMPALSRRAKPGEPKVSSSVFMIPSAPG